MASHSSTLGWKIPWMEEPGRLQSMGSLGVGYDWATSLSLFTVMHWRRKWQPTPVFLPGESQGWGSLVAAVYGVTQSRTRMKWFSPPTPTPCNLTYEISLISLLSLFYKERKTHLLRCSKDLLENPKVQHQQDFCLEFYFRGSESFSAVSDSLRPHGLYSPWNSPGQNTGMGSCSPFPIQGSNPGLLRCRRILYQLSHQERPLLGESL